MEYSPKLVKLGSHMEGQLLWQEASNRTPWDCPPTSASSVPRHGPQSNTTFLRELQGLIPTTEISDTGVVIPLPFLCNSSV